MTPYVRAKIRNCNHLRQTIHQNRQEWIDACCEANEAINEAKTESWKNLLQDAMYNSDGHNMWKVIQGLSGTPDANSPKEAMSHNGRTITDTKSKANVLTSLAFHALVHSKLDYTAPAWQPWLSDTNLSSLDCLQNDSLQLITGQLISTPPEALRLEANVQSYSTCSKRLILKANEKAWHSTDDHPKHIALDVNIPQVAQVSVKKQKNSRLSYHLIFNTDKTSLTFHLHHGSKAPLMLDESPPLSEVLPVELMIIA